MGTTGNLYEFEQVLEVASARFVDPSGEVMDFWSQSFVSNCQQEGLCCDMNPLKKGQTASLGKGISLRMTSAVSQTA